MAECGEFYLTILNGPDRGVEFKLEDDVISLGGGECFKVEYERVIFDALDVEREQAVLLWQPGQCTYLISNRSSMNPILVDDKPCSHALLRPGMRINVGSVQLQVRAEGYSGSDNSVVVPLCRVSEECGFLGDESAEDLPRQVPVWLRHGSEGFSTEKGMAAWDELSRDPLSPERALNYEPISQIAEESRPPLCGGTMASWLKKAMDNPYVGNASSFVSSDSDNVGQDSSLPYGVTSSMVERAEGRRSEADWVNVEEVKKEVKRKCEEASAPESESVAVAASPYRVGDVKEARIGSLTLGSVDFEQESSGSEEGDESPAPEAEPVRRVLGVLQVTKGPEKGLVIEVYGDVTIGRSTDCDVILSDARVSRMHCAITFENDGPYVNSLSSSNTTQVNRSRNIKKAKLGQEADIILASRVHLKWQASEGTCV